MAARFDRFAMWHASACLSAIAVVSDTIPPWFPAARGCRTDVATSPTKRRLVAARELWRLWAAIHSPKDPDHAPIKLVDEEGRRIGGSGLAGSVIKVE